MMPHHILILDDDAGLVRLYAKVIRRSGYEVQSARTIEQARAQLIAEQYDVFICDMKVNNASGFELLCEMWDALQRQQTEVIVLSGREAYRTNCDELGVKYFLQKPVTMYELTQQVNAIIENKRQLSPSR